MKQIWYATKDKQFVIVEAEGMNDAYRVAGKALGINDADKAGPENIDLDDCRIVEFGRPMDR